MSERELTYGEAVLHHFTAALTTVDTAAAIAGASVAPIASTATKSFTRGNSTGPSASS